MENKAWLQSLKPGDKACSVDRWFLGKYRTYVVERITKTQIIMSNGSKFNRESGYLVGGSEWNSLSIQELTPEIEKEVRIAKMICRLNNYEFKELNESTLIHIYNILFPKEN